MTILVIEDNPSHLKLAHHVLTAAGHDVDGVDAATRALAAVKADKPQLILLDMALPGMSGLELVRQLKADPETSDIQIVAVTSFPEQYPRAEVLEAGCVAYLTKPINTRTISAELEGLVK